MCIRHRLPVDRAARALAAPWGISRVTSTVRRRLLDLVAGASPRVEARGEFLWSRDHPPASFRGFRVPTADPGTGRSAEEIPPEEVANAAAALLPQLVSLPVPDLVRELGRLFGFARMGKRVETRMTEGVRLLASRGGCRIQDGVASCGPGPPN